MSNHLKDQSSPYLLQHAENPVDWYPWGEEAFEKAKREDKPVFLSIGYSTCHWCHVMEQESFENMEIADILNRYFVSVKVDREERPDIDSVYMSVCQALTGNGGWPMSIFMTPEQKPFFAGTYFPPISSRGMAGMHDLLLVIADKWKRDKEELLQSAERILAHISTEDEGVCEHIDSGMPEKAVRIFSENFDKKYGGFGNAPKFPTPHNLLFLTLYAQINDKKDVFKQVEVTLEKMRRGGIFDHIGFGFSRYSTDKYFFLPHFEKMLYDNALLIIAYSAAYKVSGNEIFLDTAEKTAAYVFRDLTDSEGAFYSAQDADSEGEEGRFYTWRYEEVCRLLGEERGKRFCQHFGITQRGNFEGRNIPNLLNGNEIPDDFEGEKELMYEYRKSHFKLHLDDKILTSWNALMIWALSVLYRVTGKEEYLLAAKRAQQFIEKSLAYGNTLYVSFRNHIRFVKGFLDEYAYYTAALISLYEATGESSYIERAQQICEEAKKQFADEKGSGYFLYGEGNDSLIIKPKETYDGALPSGNSVMAYCFVRLFQILGNEDYEHLAKEQLAFLSGEAKAYPTGHGMFLTAQLFYLNPPAKITVILAAGEEEEEVRKKLPLYADVNLLAHETEEYKLLNGKTTYYICKDHTCLPPVNQEHFPEKGVF
ncbi:MAG: thioredoxin domain-containing protein [Lachnospiraceae bacterium]|nr:thioredoxin domain-containing protein [Lachnospiraceae bacterium]